LTPTTESLSKVFTEAQAKIVWDAAAEAAQDMVRLAPTLTPQNFTERQTEVDAKVMLRRFLVGDLKSKIPPKLKPPATVLPTVVVPSPLPKLPGKKKPPPVKLPKIDPGKLPRPRLPKVKLNFGLVLFLGLLLLDEEND